MPYSQQQIKLKCNISCSYFVGLLTQLYNLLIKRWLVLEFEMQIHSHLACDMKSLSHWEGRGVGGGWLVQKMEAMIYEGQCTNTHRPVIWYLSSDNVKMSHSEEKA